MPKITYPRECDECNHVCNSQPAWHYHKRTHEPIPPGSVCEYGCGQPAKFKNTQRKFVCSESFNQCPARIERTSRIATQRWAKYREAVAKGLI